MHSLLREKLQQHLHAYKRSQKEEGLPILHDAKDDHQRKKIQNEEEAYKQLNLAQNLDVAFAVKANRAYDGALEDESPIKEKTISFSAGTFIHIYTRFDADWWIGRVVTVGTKLGFIPTARRIGRLEEDFEEQDTGGVGGVGVIKVQSLIWECSTPYTVVPNTRPIVFLGPAFQNSQITQLMHTALRSEIKKRMGNKVKHFKSDIGRKNVGKLPFDSNERELRTITALADNLSLVLLECPNVNVPADLAGIHLAPIFVFIKVSDRSILVRVMNRTGIKGKGELAGVDALRSLPISQFDVVIEEKGLPEATNRMVKYLEEYWEATHPSHELV